MQCFYIEHFHVAIHKKLYRDRSNDVTEKARKVSSHFKQFINFVHDFLSQEPVIRLDVERNCGLVGLCYKKTLFLAFFDISR